MDESFTPKGRFLERHGPAAGSERFCNKKLCLVATDQAYLVALLHELSQRADCYYVKYTPQPRDGMYLGRVFLLDEHEVGALWARLKRDDKLLCSVQDDDFIRPFRAE
ncbi:MAG: hypothetical protein ACM31C_16900 [Acidobacteriota bacterium]